MTAASEWRDEVGGSKLTNVFLDRAVRLAPFTRLPSVNSVHISTHTEATQTLLTWEL